MYGTYLTKLDMYYAFKVFFEGLYSQKNKTLKNYIGTTLKV